MARDTEYLHYILDILSPYGGITHRPLFGGYGIYRYVKIFAIIAYDELYFKVGDNNRQDYIDMQAEQFTYQKNNKPYKMCYWQVPEEILEDSEELGVWVEKACKVKSK